MKKSKNNFSVCDSPRTRERSQSLVPGLVVLDADQKGCRVRQGRRRSDVARRAARGQAEAVCDPRRYQGARALNHVRLDAFVVRPDPFHVPRLQDAKAKAPCRLRMRQRVQPIRDQLGLIAELELISIASVADAERPARDKDQAPARRFLPASGSR